MPVPDESLCACCAQCGFALLEAGSVRLKNTKNILLKNVMNTCLGALIWWAVGAQPPFRSVQWQPSRQQQAAPALLLQRAGDAERCKGWRTYGMPALCWACTNPDAERLHKCCMHAGFAFAHGECSPASNPVIGLAGFFSDTSDEGQGALYWSLWLFSWVFAAVSVTIPSGSLAERCQFRAYLLYTLWQSALIYPAVVHWVWSREARRGPPTPFRVSISGLGFKSSPDQPHSSHADCCTAGPVSARSCMH